MPAKKSTEERNTKLASVEEVEEEEAPIMDSEVYAGAKKSASDRAGVKFPISRLAKFAKRGKYADRIGQGVPVFMAGVLEYLTFELLELASNKAGENKKSKSIMPRDVMMAIKSDQEFNKFLRGAEFASTGRMPTYMADIKTNKKKKGADEEEEDEDFDLEEIEEDEEMVEGD